MKCESYKSLKPLQPARYKKISAMTEISVHSAPIEAYSKAIAKRCSNHN